MNDCGLIMTITAIACGIIKCCSEDDITIMSAAFSQLGDTLATYLTQKELCESKQKDLDCSPNPKQLTDSISNSNTNSNADSNAASNANSNSCSNAVNYSQEMN
ncbi:MAG: hypothetical protein K0S04_157 [Herbinix sp.]|jgi:hypothetical protein|nr:hypothetical protein [Herbinix sp.]